MSKSSGRFRNDFAAILVRGEAVGRNKRRVQGRRQRGGGEKSLFYDTFSGCAAGVTGSKKNDDGGGRCCIRRPF